MTNIKIYLLIPPIQNDKRILLTNPVLDDDEIEAQLFRLLDAKAKDINEFIMGKINDTSINTFCERFPKTADWIACIILDKKNEFDLHRQIEANKVVLDLKILNELEISDEVHVINEDIDSRYPWFGAMYWEIKSLEYSLDNS